MSLQYYNDLASNDETVRLEAAHALLSELSPANQPSAASVEYALNRLIRGLASGRESSRIGFSVAFTELLVHLLGPQGTLGESLGIDFDRVLHILKTATHPEGSASGQERRDHHFGRLFGLKAIVTSGILFQPPSGSEHWTEVTKLLLDLARKKSWLREECGSVLYEGLKAEPHCRFDVVLPVTEGLKDHNLVDTPEAVAISLRALELGYKGALTSLSWENGDPLEPSNFARLAKILKETSLQKDKSKTPQDAQKQSGSIQRGTWNGKLHFVWDAVFARLYERADLTEFKEFWDVVIDETLFSAQASEERKYWGFLIFIKALRVAPSNLLVCIYSKNLLRCLINQLSKKDRYLHTIAQRAVREILFHSPTRPGTAVTALQALLGPNGSPSFDQISKSKTIEGLLSQAEDHTLVEMLHIIERIMISPATDDTKAAESRRQVLADLCLHRLRGLQAHAFVDDVEGAIELILRIFVEHGYFIRMPSEKSPKATPPFSLTTQKLLRTRLFSCLGVLMPLTPYPGHAWLYKTLRIIRKLEKCSDHSLVIEFDTEIAEALGSARRRLKEVHKKKSRTTAETARLFHAFELLYSLIILRIYDGDQESLSSLEDLEAYYNGLPNVESKSGIDVHASVSRVQLFLSLCVQRSKLLRKLVEQVFGAFAFGMNADALWTMLEVLSTSESIKGQEEIFDREDDEAESPSDAEDVGINGGELHKSDQSASGGDDDDDEIVDVEDMDADEAEKLDAALADALGTRRADKLDEASSSNDSDMDDEQMMVLDGHLAKIFRERKKITSKKQEKKDAKENIIHFKGRVLDLLTIYVKQQQDDSEAAIIIKPTLVLIRTTASKVLVDKARNLLREFSQACKSKHILLLNKPDQFWDILDEVHAEAMRGASKVHASACSQMSLLLARALVAGNRENAKGLVQIYADTWTQWLLQKKCKVQPSFFTDFVNWSTTASKQLQR